jgi:hypothetical protein
VDAFCHRLIREQARSADRESSFEPDRSIATSKPGSSFFFLEGRPSNGLQTSQPQIGFAVASFEVSNVLGSSTHGSTVAEVIAHSLP